jgi:hypothetical protein
VSAVPWLQAGMKEALTPATHQTHFEKQFCCRTFMDSSPVMFSDLAKFVDATDTAVRQNECSGLQHPLAVIFHGRAG